MKLKLLLFLTVALLGFGFMRPDVVVQAQDGEPICTPTNCGQAVHLDWVVTGRSWCNAVLAHKISAGWTNCIGNSSVYRVVGIDLRLEFGEDNLQNISNFDMSWLGWQDAGGTVMFERCRTGRPCPDNQYRLSVNWVNGQFANTEFPALVEGVYSISVNVGGQPGTVANIPVDDARDYIVLNDIRFCANSFFCEPKPEYYQPLSEIVAELPTIDGVSVSSPLPGAPVHAAADGVITSINPVMSDCINIDMLPCQDDPIQLATVNAYIVHLSTTDVNFIYLVANAQDYIRPGLAITASCIMGETLTGNTREGHTSVGNVSASSEMTEIILSLSPLPDSQPCIAVTPPSAPESCVDGSPLSSGEWRGAGVHEWVGDTVRLSAGASIRQISALTDDIPTQLTFKASKSNPDTEGSVTVVIGSGNYNFTLTTLPDQHQTPSTIHKSNASGFHELKITNTSQQTITIHSTCVQIKLGLLYPDDCYFVNHDFSRGAYGWYLSSTVIAEMGQVKIPIPQEGSISQPVVIFAGDDGYAYTLDVMVKLWFYPEYQADRNSIDSVQLSFSFYDVGTPMVIGTETFGAFGDGDDVVTFSQSFMIEDDVDDALQIQVDITTTDPDVRGITIREVCLSPQDDNWIGYEDNLPSSQKPFFEICRANPMPSGLNIGKWFEWLMNGILNLFSCELMRVFNGFWNWLQWLQLSIVEGINWIGNTLLPWLGGHFFNLNFIQDIVRTIQPVFDVFEMIIDAGIGIFKQIVGVISSIATLIIELFNAWNDTTPIPPPFLPNCNIAPETQNICILFWAIEVTVLDGQLGQLIIPMFSANIAVLGTIYFIKRFQRLFERSARNV